MAAFTWFHSSQQAVAPGSAITEFLTNIVTLVNANSGNAAASWQLASDQSGASPAYVTLKRKNGAAGRIMFIAGTAQNAAATRATAPATNILYIGYAPTTTSDTATTSYASGAPYADWMLSCGISGISANFRINYSDADAGMVFSFTKEATGIAVGMAGPGLFEQRDGTACPLVMASGGTVTAWPSNSTMFQSSITTNATGTTNGLCTFFRRPSGSPAEIQVFRTFQVSLASYTGSSNAFRDDTASRRFFLPILFAGPTDIVMGYAGKLRQMAFGIDAVCQFAMLAAGGGAEVARALTYNDTTVHETLWLTQFEV